MANKQVIGRWGTWTMAVSLLYMVLFFVFGNVDSHLFDKRINGFVCCGYGLFLLFFSYKLLMLSLSKAEFKAIQQDLFYNSTQEQALDEWEDETPMSKDKIDRYGALLLNGIHIGISLFIFLGQLLYSYALVAVMGFVYAIFWTIIGCIIFYPLYKQ